MADNKATQRPKKKTAGDDTQLIPLIVKFLKVTGVAFSVWCLGYSNFSASWLLIGAALYMWRDRHVQRKHLQMRIQQQIAGDEEATILARVEDLPSWVNFPDVERAEWFNKILDQIWPFIGDYVKKLLMESIQEKIRQSHSSMASFSFTHIDLGDIPPRIGGIKVYTENVKRDEIYMDVDIIYSSDCFIEVKVKGITAGIKHLQIRGNLRVIFKPLIGQMPLFGGISVFFINNPEINYDLTGVANSLDLPGLSDMLDTIIAEQIAAFMVLPNRIVVPMVENVHLMMLKYPAPDGVLRIHVLEAKDLIKADVGLMKKGKSDPYAVIRVGAYKFKTKVINDTVEPKWNAVFEAIIDLKDGQYIEFELRDEDPGSKDDPLGNVNMEISKVAEDGMVDSWLPLADVKHGMLHVRLVWMHLSSDLTALKEVSKQAAKDQALKDMSSCILMVNLDSARELPRNKKQMAEPNPHVVLTMGQEKKESTVKMSTDSPRWEENFRFLCVDPKFQTLEVEVMDKKNPLGNVVVPVKSILSATDMTLDQYFNLKNSGPQSQIHMRLCLRVLTTDKSKAAVDEPIMVQTPDAVTEGSPVDNSSQSSPSQPKPSKTPGDDVPKAPKPAEAQLSTQAETLKSKPVSAVIPPAKPSGPGTPTEGTELKQRKSTSPTTPTTPTSSAPLLDPKGAFGHGRLQLTLRYSSQRKCLVVVVHKCVNLIPCDDDNLADPYIKMYLLPDKSKKLKTQIKKNDLNPVFDETFEFMVVPSELPKSKLDLTIRNDTSVFSGNKKTMGTLVIDMANLDQAKATTQWFDVRPDDYEGSPASLSSDV